MTNQKKAVILTMKQLRVLLDSLRSTETLRSKEAEREYIRKTIRKIKEQTV